MQTQHFSLSLSVPSGPPFLWKRIVRIEWHVHVEVTCKYFLRFLGQADYDAPFLRLAVFAFYNKSA